MNSVVALYHSNTVVMYCNKHHHFDNDLWSNEWNLEHNAELLQEIVIVRWILQFCKKTCEVSWLRREGAVVSSTVCCIRFSEKCWYNSYICMDHTKRTEYWRKHKILLLSADHIIELLWQIYQWNQRKTIHLAQNKCQGLKFLLNNIKDLWIILCYCMCKRQS